MPLTELELKDALEKEQFYLSYQPIVALKLGGMIGAEALVRWRHSERGIVFPSEFIPLAEKTGLIVPLGQWVFRTACLQYKAWRDAGYRDFLIFINFSAIQFQDRMLIDKVRQVLEESDMPKNLIQAEITEGAMLETVGHATSTLNQLRDLGLGIAIDDFEDGTLSLDSLSTLPIQTIKIGQELIKHLLSDSKAQAVFEIILSIAQRLKLNVIVEGVETKKQLSFLADRNCDTIQGFVYSGPLNTEQMTEFLVHKPSLVPCDRATWNEGHL